MRTLYGFKRHWMLAFSLAMTALAVSPTAISGGFPEPGDFSRGATSWANNCSRCHNMRDPQDLRDDQWITTAFHMRVRAGLTGQQTRDILTFMQESNNVAVTETVAFNEGSAPVSSSLSGAEIYTQGCVACHGANGKGTVPGAPDFTQENGRLSQSDEVLLRNMSQGVQSPGSPMAMPPKGGNSSLTEADLHSVLVYMRKTFTSQ